MSKRPALYALFAVVCPVGLNNTLLPCPLCPYTSVREYAAALPIRHLMP